MSDNKSIVLIGFMGVGKTTVGKELANALAWEYIDTDEQIEKKFGMATTDIFKTHGEATFRSEEKAVITKLCTEPNRIISVGGGAFLQEEIRNACLEHAIVVHLHMSFEAWQNRIPVIIDSRPVLQGKSMDEIKALYDERQAIYAHHNLQLNVDDLTPDQTASVIMEQLNL